jgi:hypothetical protein
MTTFTIDAENNITAHAGTAERSELAEGEQQFTSETELTKLAAAWPGTRLVEIWNSLPGVQEVRKFTSRPVAVRRIWKAIQTLDPGVAPQGAKGAKKKGGRGQKATAKKAAATGTKTEQIIALLKQPSGATLKALMAATAWQSHSIRGFISGQLVKKMGLRVKSFKRDGERVYAVRN